MADTVKQLLIQVNANTELLRTGLDAGAAKSEEFAGKVTTAFAKLDAAAKTTGKSFTDLSGVVGGQVSAAFGLASAAVTAHADTLTAAAGSADKAAIGYRNLSTTVTGGVTPALGTATQAVGRAHASIAGIGQQLLTGASAASQFGAVFRAGAKPVADIEEAASKLNGSLGQQRSNMLELGHVGRSLFDSLAAGASPFRALASEGGRLSEIIAESGPKGLLSAVGGFSRLLGGPLVVGGLAAAGAVAFLIYKFDSANEAATKINNALSLTANTAGFTAASITTMSAQLAHATDSSEALAKSLLTSLATSGKFTADEVNKLGAAAIGLASRTGQAADEVISQFVRMADGPTKYAETFSQQYALLDAATVQHVRELEAQGDKTKAVEVLTESLYQKLGTKAPENLGFLERAWHSVQRAIEGASNAALAFGTTKTSGDTNIDRLTGELDQLKTERDSHRFYQRGPDGKPVEITSRSPADQAAVDALNVRINQLSQLVAVSQHADAVTAQNAAKQQRGIAADAELYGDTSRDRPDLARAAKSAERKRIADALAANPNDALALAAQKDLPRFDARTDKQFSPETQADQRDADKAKREAEAAQRKRDAEAKRAAAAAEKARKEDAAGDKEVEDADLKLRKAKAAQADDAEALAQISRDEIEQARRDRARQINEEARANPGKITEARRQQLLADNDQLAAVEASAVTTKEQQRLLDERLKTQLAELDADKAQLEGRLAEAKTAAERRRIQLEILAIEKEEATDKAQRQAASNNPVTRAQGQATLANIDSVYAGRTDKVLQQTRGPLETYIDGLKTTPEQKQEAFQGAEVGALKTLEGDILSTTGKVLGLKGAFGDLFNGILQGVEKVVIEEELIQPLAKLLQGGSGSGGGGLGGGLGGIGGFFSKLFGGGGGDTLDIPSLSDLSQVDTSGLSDLASSLATDVPDLSAAIPGFAAGGDTPVGSPFLVGENGPEILMSKTPSTVIPNHRIGGLGGGSPITFDLRGAVMTQDILDQINTKTAQAAQTGALLGRTGAAQDSARTRRRSLVRR